MGATCTDHKLSQHLQVDLTQNLMMHRLPTPTVQTKEQNYYGKVDQILSYRRSKCGRGQQAGMHWNKVSRVS